MLKAVTKLKNRSLHKRAYAAWDRGELREASRYFGELLQREPDHANYHYMQGLVHKYLRDWKTSLHHNLRSQALREERDESSLWNSGIAATALGDWTQARQAWTTCGIAIAEGEGPIDGDFGIASIRLNAWDQGETLYAKRIDVVRARLLNVPFPESGYRYGDIVLHDGASTGRRPWGDGTVPVLNALERLEVSEFRTFTAFVQCEDQAAMTELRESRLPGIAHVEDWSESVRYYCMRCSYGVLHNHDKAESEEGDWDMDRTLGIAAQSRASVEKLLTDWRDRGPGRLIDGIELREHPLSSPEDGVVWWDSPAE
jgi:hypothetical protein